MRIIFKIIAAPFVLVLTILVAVLDFLLSVSSGILSVIALILALLSIISLVTAGGNDYFIRTGIAGLIMGFLISPFGIPAIGEWISGLLDSLNYSLKNFITS